MRLRLAILALIGALGTVPAQAAETATAATATAMVEAFEHFIRRSTPICEDRPAIACVEAGWRFADRDGDSKVSLAELQDVRRGLLDWAEWRGDSLRKGERAAIAFGVWLADAVGLENLLASFNQNGDGGLSQAELLADVKLDQRPLGKVLLDPEAVDREAVAQRLGRFAPLLKGLLRPAE